MKMIGELVSIDLTHHCDQCVIHCYMYVVSRAAGSVEAGDSLDWRE